MELTIFQGDDFVTITDSEPYGVIFESKPSIIEIRLNSVVSNCLVFIGDKCLQAVFVESTDNNFFIYRTKESRVFLNCAGYVFISIEIDQQTEHAKNLCVNVLSSKINAERLSTMLNYISSFDKNFLYTCFSKSLMQSNGVDSFYTDTYFKVIQTEKILEYLWSNRNKFLSQPCKRLKSVDSIKKFSVSDRIDDRSINWLFSNLNELSIAEHPEDTIFEAHFQRYTARNILTAEIIEDTDIFENHVIMSFLMSVQTFIDDISEAEKINGERERNQDHFNIVPMIQNFVIKNLGIQGSLIERVKALCYKCEKFVSDNLTESRIKNIKPKITQFVSRQNHYLTLFRLINDWWNIKTIDPVVSDSVFKYFFSVKSLDDIYEIYVLLKLIGSLKNNSFTVKNSSFIDYTNLPSLSNKNEIDRPLNEIFNYYLLENELFSVEINYEPKIFCHRPDVIENEIYSIGKCIANLDAVKLFKKGHYKTPDYVFRITNKTNNNNYIYILDAKFSSYETVLNERMPSKNMFSKEQGLIDKYLHGLRVNRLGRATMIDGIFATFASGNKPESRPSVLPSIHPDYTLFGLKPMLPLVDIINFVPSEKSEKDEVSFFIHKLLEVSA